LVRSGELIGDVDPLGVVESVENVSEDVFDRIAIRVMRCEAEEDLECRMVRRRRGRRLLMVQ